MVSSDAAIGNEMVWEYLQKPVQGHPDGELLWEAEEAIQSIGELSENPDIKNAFARRLEEYKAEILSAASPVQTTEHSIAFIGNNGVGKTTAMCRIVGLEVSEDNVPVLETGAGGTTLCEVTVKQGTGYGLAIEPRSEEEISKEVREFARYLVSLQEPNHAEYADGTDFQGTSPEIARVIRTMSGLTSRERGSDGRFVDLAGNLAREFPDSDSLATEILKRMNIPGRTELEVTYSDDSEEDPLLWLKDTFEQVNNGRHPDFSIPDRIEIRVSQAILAQESYSITLVDTKGIDDTAEREDLERHFREPNTVVVLCSSFNDAPAPSAQQILERVKEGGIPELDAKSAVLVLPRPKEAIAVKFDDGFPVTDSAEGYDLKKDKAATQLGSRNLPFAGIEFFNVSEDDPRPLTVFLTELVNGLRARHSTRLEEAIKGANATVQNFEKEQESEILRAAARRLEIWLQNNAQVGIPSRRLQDSLLEAIQTVNASSLRASVNRQGEWRNLDYPYQLGSGARSAAYRAVNAKRQGFKAIADNLLQDTELEDAHDLVRQALSIMDSRVNLLLEVVRSVGVTVHERNMKPDGRLWEQCVSEWGRGSGYRGRVLDHNRTWFDGPNRNSIHAEMQAVIENQWQQILGRISAILPADD